MKTLFLIASATLLAMGGVTLQLRPIAIAEPQQYAQAGGDDLPEINVSRPAKDRTYGYTEANPIKVGGPNNGPLRERIFLGQLAGPKGENITFRRQGSCCPFRTPRGLMGGGLLDRYEVTIEGDPVPKILYLNMYDYEEPRIPYGFTTKKR